MALVLPGVSVLWPVDREPAHPNVGYGMHVERYAAGEGGVEDVTITDGVIDVEKADGVHLHFVNVPFVAEYVDEPEE